MAGASSQDAQPVFSAVATPAVAPAGTTTTFSIALTELTDDESHASDNDDENEGLGSVQLSPPAGFTIISASALSGTTVLPATVSGNTVTVDGVDLHDAGQSVVISIVAFVSCSAPAAGSWTVIGHATHDYASQAGSGLAQDPLSQLSVVLSPCSVAFVHGRGPAESQVATNISSEPANPAGRSVEVQLVDGAGAPASEAGISVTLAISPGTGTSGASLAATLTVQTDAAGVASFGQLSIDRSGLNYRLDATSIPGSGSATSSPFDIHDVLVPCPVSCTATDTRGNTTGTVVVPASTDPAAVLGLSLDLETLDCNDAANHFYVSSSKVLTFDFRGTATNEIVTITLAKSSVTKPAAKYQVCYSSPKTAFVNRFGVAIPAGAAGLLPDCSVPEDDHSHHLAGAASTHHDPDVANPPPCVQRRGKDLSGNVFVTFLTREGDPRGKI